jgi:hypothetical protein
MSQQQVRGNGEDLELVPSDVGPGIGVSKHGCSSLAIMMLCAINPTLTLAGGRDAE